MTPADNGYSGTNFERPAVQELIELVRQGKINCIIVKDFSRFGRNSIETGYFIERVFPLYKTRFISISDGFDSAELEGDTGGMDVALKFLIHELYSKDLSRKIKSAKREKMRRGEHISKNCIFGYKKVGNRLEIDESAAETVRMIFDMKNDGKKLFDIEQHLYQEKRPTPAEHKSKVENPTCIWRKSAIYDMIRNEQYIGTYIAGKHEQLEFWSKTQIKVSEDKWIKIPNHHPAIVGKSVFDGVQEIINKKIEAKRKKKLGTHHRYSDKIKSPLKGKVVCGYCNHVMTYKDGKNAVFHCVHTRSAPDKECHNLKVSVDELESAVYEKITNHMKSSFNIDNFNDLSLQNKQKLDNDKLITQLENEKRAIYEGFVGGNISKDEFLLEKSKLDKRLDELHKIRVIMEKETVKQSAENESKDKISQILKMADGENGLTHQLNVPLPFAKDCSLRKDYGQAQVVNLLIDKIKVFKSTSKNLSIEVITNEELHILAV